MKLRRQKNDIIFSNGYNDVYSYISSTRGGATICVKTQKDS